MAAKYGYRTINTTDGKRYVLGKFISGEFKLLGGNSPKYFKSLKTVKGRVEVLNKNVKA